MSESNSVRNLVRKNHDVKTKGIFGKTKGIFQGIEKFPWKDPEVPKLSIILILNWN